MEEDWDLQAVVRSCTTTTTTSSSSFTTATTTTNSTCSTDVLSLSRFRETEQEQEQEQEQDDHFLYFPDLHKPRTDGIEDLHDLYKPFFPKLQPLYPQIMPISPLSVLGGLQDLSQQQQKQQESPKQVLVGSRSTISSSASASTRQAQTSRSKRRKNQMKRVCQVPAEGLSSDMWSWRKYGQKPIKGSPYPRGYYRCSTSKGCLARKQVERNRSDPAMFIVTYTSEHNHPMPTHRNSLAGSTRQKPTTPQAVSDGDTSKYSCSPPVSPAKSLSPAEKTEGREEKEDMVEDEDDDIGVSDMALSDDFFTGLEEFVGPDVGDGLSDHFPAALPFPWLGNNATTTAAGGG